MTMFSKPLSCEIDENFQKKVDEIFLKASEGGNPDELYLRLAMLLERNGEISLNGKEMMMTLYRIFEVRRLELSLVELQVSNEGK